MQRFDARMGHYGNMMTQTAKHTQMASLHTRRRKEDKGLADLVPEWRERARALGLVREKTALAPSRPLDPVIGRAGDCAACARAPTCRPTRSAA